MVQIKVTPEMLEEVANRASNTRIALESIHNNLCNEIDQLCFQWIGASNQQFIQLFNDARPKAFASIHSLVKVEEDLKRIAEKFRNTDNQDVTIEKGAMCGPLSSEKENFDGEKLARDIVGEISGEYDIRRAWDGIDPSTGEKLSTLDRVFAGGMAVAGLTPFGKIAKVGKGVKMTAKAAEAVNKAKKVPVEKVNGVKDTVKATEDSIATKKPYSKSRPSYGKGQVEEVWENAKDSIDGKVYDPSGVEIIWDKSKSRSGQWDMGHIPGEKYSDMHELYMNEIITKEEFLKWYRNPENYRPELPSTNRSHKYE
ncbi:WXG100 family type VII secretion target [Bacillus paramobilis]|uniref:WXG100 family type VII secretion target n=1 Tax=Bacillus paramobilis TaxID=2817477 RepID=UPI003D251D50